MAAIKHLYHIAQDREQVFAAVSTTEGITGWWTSVTSGDGSLGGLIDLKFGPQWALQMKVTALEPGRTVEWEFTKGAPDWIGTRARFDFDENEGKTRVRFSHTGFQNQDDNWAACNFSWGRYLESLRQLCQTQVGKAYGSPAYQR